MNKYLILCLTFALSLTLTSIVTAKSYNQISPQELKTRMDSGDIVNGKLMVFSTQNPQEFSTGYLPQAIQTFARPLETEEDYRKLDIILARAQKTTEDIVVICPRGGSGATRPYDYLEKNGIDSKRLFVLTKGQETYNKVFPGDVVKP
jgi:thiosulfate/3-mercaptopyruvate sulfurtransferase